MKILFNIFDKRQTFLLIAICLIQIIECHYIPKIKGTRVDISAYTNQAKQIQIPFKKCFQVETQLPANSKYIKFQPSSIKLTEVGSVLISQNHQVSLLDDLRSPLSFTHEHLIAFQHYAITFLPPNLVILIKQQENGKFKVLKKIVIKQINEYTQFKMYKFNNETMMILYRMGQAKKDKIVSQFNKVRAFIINTQTYYEIKVPISNKIAHFQANGRQFFTAEYSGGVQCYSYAENNKAATIVASYSKQLFKNFTNNPYIVDINIDNLQQNKIIYALDGIKGVFKLNLSESLKTPKVELIISEPNCNAMDSMNIDHIVLVCQLGSASYIIQAYGNKTATGETVFQKLQPEYHVNYFNDLQINRNYFLVFSYRTLNVYWSSKQNSIPQTVNTRSQLDLPGLETFYFRMSVGPKNQSYLYAIQSGVLKKMLMQQSPARLFVKSSTVADKNFNISIFGNCQDLPASDLDRIFNASNSSFNIVRQQGVQTYTCQLQRQVRMEIIEQLLPRKEDFSVSASIIVILIVIFLLIIWICLKKYKGLQRQARKVLEAYKKKRSRI